MIDGEGQNLAFILGLPRSGTTLLSVMMALITYGFTRSNLVSQRDASAVRQAEQNARFIEVNLPSNPKVKDLLTSLQTPASSSPLVYYRGRYRTIADH